MGIIRNVIAHWVVFNGGKIDKTNGLVSYLIPVGQIDEFFLYLRECLSFEDTNMFSCRLQNGYMVIPRYSIEQNL